MDFEFARFGKLMKIQSALAKFVRHSHHKQFPPRLTSEACQFSIPYVDTLTAIANVMKGQNRGIKILGK